MIKPFLSLILLGCFAFTGLAQNPESRPAIRHQIGYETGFDLPVERVLFNRRSYVYYGPAYHQGLQYAFRPNRWLQLEAGLLYSIDYQSVLDFSWPIEQLYTPIRRASVAMRSRVNWLQRNRFEASSFLMAQPRFSTGRRSDLYLALGSGVAYRYHELLFKADVVATPLSENLSTLSSWQPGMRFGVNYCF